MIGNGLWGAVTPIACGATPNSDMRKAARQHAALREPSFSCTADSDPCYRPAMAEVRSLETDYLVVGAGAAGMAFTDELLRHSDATVTIIDRRHAPGGHWLEAYPFVRLHQPSTFYGVTSAPLVQDAFDVTGTNAGFYELASGQRDPRLLRAGHLRRRPNE